MTNWSPSTVLPSLTRELHFRQEKFWIRPTALTPHLEHTGLFTNVKTLVFCRLVTSAFDATSLSDCFGTFLPSVQCLRLHHPITRPKSLAQLVLFFSNVVDIEIQFPQWSTADEDGFLSLCFPPQKARLTGELLLRGFGRKWSSFFTLLSAEKLGFQKTRLVGCEFDALAPTQTLLDTISSSARTLHLVGPNNRASVLVLDHLLAG